MPHEHVNAACPKCKSKYLRRSRYPNFFSRAMCSLKGQLPYRCMNCDCRFHVFVPRNDMEAAELQSRRVR
jgi:hypothetical protein